MKKATAPTRARATSGTLRLGFIALSDCAPIVMASELGLYAKYGLRVQLSREPGWATIRDKIIYRELEAAHATAGMVFASTYGLGSVPAECVTALLLNLNGIGITLSEKLWQQGVRDGTSLGEHVRSQPGPHVFGTVFPFSSHNFLLRQWLVDHGIRIGVDAQMVIVPPAQMFQNLKAGLLDGYCVGEPWNSLAVAARVGWCAALGSELDPRHPEKVLMVRREFATEREDEHLALIAALLESCRFCDQPENRERIVETLAQPNYVNAPIGTIRHGMNGTFDFGHGRVEKFPDFHVFSRNDANDPTPEKAAWVIRHMDRCGLLQEPVATAFAHSDQIFRRDLYLRALGLVDLAAV